MDDVDSDIMMDLDESLVVVLELLLSMGEVMSFLLLDEDEELYELPL